MTKAKLDAVAPNTNLGDYFARQLEYVESELRTVEYGPMKARNLIPFTSVAGDNKWYTWRLFDRVGSWRFGSSDMEDVPMVDIFGAELPIPIRMIAGGYKYNVQELLAAKQAASNRPNDPSIQIDVQRAKACFDAYEQWIDNTAWFGDYTKAKWAGVGGILYNPYMPTIAAAAGVTNSNTKIHWFSSAGVRQKEQMDILTDLNNLLTYIRTNSMDRYQADTLVLPIKHHAMLTSTPMSTSYPNKTIMQFFLENHPEITTIETVVAVNNVPAGGVLSSATDVIWAYKKSNDVLKMENPRMFTQMPVQERGFNYIIPCWATTAGVIVYKPLAMAFLTTTSANGISDNS
jgi:hypothetical protein